MSLLITALLVTHLQLDIRVYDSAGVSPGEFARARATAGAILASVGIEPIWRPCHATPCVGPVKPHEVAVRIVVSTALSARDSLGFAVIDGEQHMGALATIYEDRVRALAGEAEVGAGDLLGRAIAHEIGHVLLGRAEHTHTGLMRAVWGSGELKRDRPSDWAFSRAEGEQLRRQLAARVDQPPVQAASLTSCVDAIELN
jgi:hypothetical protein